MNIYEKFQMDLNAEKEGIEYKIGDSIFKIARAGGTNFKFKEAYDQIALNENIENLSNEDGTKLLVNIFVDGCLIGWENVEGPGGLIEFSKEKAKEILNDLPELFNKLYVFSQDMNNYLEANEKK